MQYTQLSRRSAGGKIDWEKQYLTFIPVEDAIFTWAERATSGHLEYSLNGGQTWVTIANGGSTPTIKAGSKVIWRGDLTPSTVAGSQGIGTFSASGLYDAMGNTMSLLYGDNYIGQTTLVGTYTFYQLWYNDTHIHRADRMVLSALSMTQNCYRMMFFQCFHLITAPVINAIATANSCCYDMYQKCTRLLQASDLYSAILTPNCYRNMYNGCAQLSYIKMLATDISASFCLSAWVSNVSPTGTLVKNAAMTTLPTGASGIPSGWTVVDDNS